MPDTLVTTDPVIALLENLIERPMIFPGEDPALYEGLREALLHDLAPRSPYERLLAENLVTLEWEAQRHRRMRDDRIRTKARDLAVGVFATGKLREIRAPSTKDATLASDLLGRDPKRRATAASALQARDVTPGEIVARAYSLVADEVEPHERALAAIETRRRRLREEYDRLRAARPRPVEDAEIIE